MELYVGLDVSLKETSICVVDRGGEIVSEGTVISEPSAIAAFIEAKAVGAKRIGLETGPTKTWLWHELRALGLPAICIDARHAKAALSLQINKSDRNDAVGLARIMQCGWYKEVQVKSPPCHEVRAVLNSRAQLVKVKRDLENQIRGLLKNHGLVIGKAGGNIFRRRAEELVGEHRLLQEAVRPLLAVREVVRREIADVTRKLLALARNNDESRRLMTVPGIGPINALAFCAAIDDPSRFRFDGKGFYVKSGQEMLEVWHDHPQAVHNSMEIAERCNLEIPMGTYHMPEYQVPAGMTREQVLERDAWDGLRTRLGMAPDEPFQKSQDSYVERMNYELGVIKQMGFAGYFLIVADFINYAKNSGVPVGPGRGSSAGSLGSKGSRTRSRRRCLLAAASCPASKLSA